MDRILSPNQKIVLESSQEVCQVREYIGGGGQGEVYVARLREANFALKWYNPQAASGRQRETLHMLVERHPPDNSFLWPMDLASSPGVRGFGYLMRLREKRYASLIDFLNGLVDPSFRTLVSTALGLVNAFLRLHSEGLCYCDISYNNVFFDPKTGEVLVCDNDNVDVDGSDGSGVLGTHQFMAPEIAVGNALPSIQGDLHSLAVLLFYLLMMHHPLEGRKEAEIKCLDFPAKLRLYGKEPVFIFDPYNGTNRPVPGMHDNALAFWPIYPGFLRELFTRAFTEGLHHPERRVRESEWRAAFLRCRDVLFLCPHCQSENFFNELEGDDSPGQECWNCHNALPPPLRIRFGRNSVVLCEDTRLYPHHLDPKRRNDFSQVVAELSRHPEKPNLWGLRNLSGDPWVSTTPRGQFKVEPGRAVLLLPGTQINFGGSVGEIK